MAIRSVIEYCRERYTYEASVCGFEFSDLGLQRTKASGGVRLLIRGTTANEGKSNAITCEGAGLQYSLNRCLSRSQYISVVHAAIRLRRRLRFPMHS